MKRKTATLLSIALIVLLLASCATSKTEIVSEPVVEPAIEAAETAEAAPEVPPAAEPAVEKAPSKWKSGDIGPDGGFVFECNSMSFETSQAIYDCASYDQAKKQIEGLGFRLPTLEELKALYEQLVLTEKSDYEWTYYWSCDEFNDGNVMILNFDTGFEGKFYKDIDFVSAIGVKEV